MIEADVEAWLLESPTVGVGPHSRSIRRCSRADCWDAARPVAEELADIGIYLCAIANRYNVDLEQAFRDKEEVNRTRVWT